MELFVDRGSEVDLLVHTISLDDALAGTVRRPIKTRQTLTTAEEIATNKAGFNDERRQAFARYKPFGPRGAPRPGRGDLEDAAAHQLAHALLPFRAAGGGDDGGGRQDRRAGRRRARGVGVGRPGRDGLLRPQPVDAEPRPEDVERVPREQEAGARVHQGRPLGRKPLPDPFPYKDDGAGLYFPDPADPGKGRVFAPIAAGVHRAIRPAPNLWRPRRAGS